MGLTYDIFFEFSLGPFEVVEAEGGRLVKEADFEAEIFFLLKQSIWVLYSTLQGLIIGTEKRQMLVLRHF